MKKVLEWFFPDRKNKKLNLSFKKMKLTLIFSMIVFLSFGNGFSQVKVTFQYEKATIQEVMQAIEEQTGYVFLYKDDLFDPSKKYSVNFTDEPFDQALKSVFETAGVEFTVRNNRQVILTEKEKETVLTIAAQQRTITGVVTDSEGEPLPGVTVVVPGTTTGTVTNASGEFSLQVPPNITTLQFSFVGMRQVEVNIEGRSTVTVTMEQEAFDIEEVVAVGYGVQRKSDLTGATERLTEKDMNKSVATNPVEMMQGRVAGVNIVQNSGEPGTGMSVRIRGSNSIRSGQDPLYVVDGIPLDNTDITPNGGTAAGINETSNKNPIAFLNPEDIESIDILKDASSTAIYGARGANGVVIITTKKGQRGEGTLQYDGYAGISSIRKKLPVLSAEQFRSYTKPDGTKLLDLGASTNWQDEIFTTGITNSHNLSYGGGTENFTYQTSFGYLKQEGIIDNTFMEKMNSRINVTHRAFDGKLNLTGSLVGSHITDQRAPVSETGGFEGDLILTALKLNPTYPIYNEDDTYYQHAIDQRNPVAMINLVDDQTLTQRILANFSADFEVMENLSYRLNLGFDRTVAERRVNQDEKLDYLVNQGEADINGVTANNQLIENFITYEKMFNDEHRFNFLAGHAYQNIHVKTTEVNVTGFNVEEIKYTDNLQYGNFSSADVNSSANERELQSFFGRINYNYRERYLLTLTGRADGSSKFGEERKYGFFPSAAFAWRLSEEDFMDASGAISNLKLRLGWGLTGNQEIPDKVSLLAVGTEPSANAYAGGALGPGITFLRTPNPEIQWETTMQTNIGLDFGLWENRLAGSIDFYNKSTRDVLLEIPSKQPAATQTQWQNVPDLRIVNNGVELGLTGLLVNTNNLTWELTGTFSYIKNEVKDLPVKLIETGVASGQGLSDTRAQVITNGEPVGTFYGRVFEGFDSEGFSIFKQDAEGNDALEPLGSALPDYTFSLTSNLTFGNFDFSMFWYGSAGNKVYNNTANALFLKGPLNTGFNVTEKVFESDENPSNANAFSSRFVEDASFLRLSNLTLGYTINTGTINWLNSARIYITGNNLLVLTGYSGYDPEANVDANFNNVPSLGIDYTSYPKPRTFTLGLNLQF
jgi:TonB-dependent starch-binding outer membrane protein SusC